MWSAAVERVEVDKYGHNLEQIKRGLVWHYEQYQREQSPTDQKSYAVAEIEARGAKVGLWRYVRPNVALGFQAQQD